MSSTLAITNNHDDHDATSVVSESEPDAVDLDPQQFIAKKGSRLKHYSITINNWTPSDYPVLRNLSTNIVSMESLVKK